MILSSAGYMLQIHAFRQLLILLLMFVLKLCEDILQRLMKHPSSWPFLEPVDKKQVSSQSFLTGSALLFVLGGFFSFFSEAAW